MRNISKRAALARENGVFSDWNVDTNLCDLCSLLIYLAVSSFSRHDLGKPEWPQIDADILINSPSGKVFWHHGLAHFRDVAGHACPLCRLFTEALWDKLAQDPDDVWDDRAPLEIGIYTWYPPVSSPTFKAGFSHMKSTDRLEFNFSEQPRGNSLSAGSIRRASQLLWTCINTHPSCSRRDNPLPTRVIDVGLNKETASPRLVATEGQTGSYIALSHCWGNSVNHVLTKERVRGFERGIELDKLTRTFTHAVYLARELGIRWLWIDALCIIQDSDRDWHREALKMAKVYENAVMVLSAASGPDSSSGMEFKRSAKVLKNMLAHGGHGVQQTEAYIL
ncbi:hypothetical protein SLS55_000989 [Diplodia seriata]|uniref:Heterokaryon incompatibility domain-containing protein n=1 Tax=Diplodia seriata TaxID=420778 RepID=A0ABR3CVV4_9PEZI